jgi:peptide/nickel transport system substrate-binding protein
MARCVVVILLLSVLAVLPATAGAPPSRVPPNVLVFGMTLESAVSLDPAQGFEFETTWVMQHLYDQLVGLPRDFSRAVPGLAVSWNATADLKTYTFRLRTGARFHSGNPVDARAVEFSFRRVMQLKLSPSFILTDFIAKPEDVVAIGSDQVRVTFNQAMPENFMAALLSNEVASIVDPAVVRRNATSDDPLANKWLTDHDAGSGPYELIGWNKNLKVEMKAFDGYWGGRPRMGRVFVQNIAEPTTQQLALQRGDIDFAANLLPTQARALAGQPGFVVKSTPTFTVRYLAMNAQHEPFKNKAVRNAIKWAIDYEGVRRVFDDALDAGQTIVPARMFGHLADRPYRRDLNRARALLREGGFERGFKVELVSGSDPPLPDLAAKVKEDLAQIGIEVDIRILRGAEVLAIYRGQRHQMVFGRWGADYPDPDNLAKAFADFDSRVLAWRTQWDHPVKQTVKQAVVERDRAKRDAMYKEIQRIVLDDGPFVVFGYQERLVAMRSNVKGLDPSPLAYTFNFAATASKE